MLRELLSEKVEDKVNEAGNFESLSPGDRRMAWNAIVKSIGADRDYLVKNKFYAEYIYTDKSSESDVFVLKSDEVNDAYLVRLKYKALGRSWGTKIGEYKKELIFMNTQI